MKRDYFFNVSSLVRGKKVGIIGRRSPSNYVHCGDEKYAIFKNYPSAYSGYHKNNTPPEIADSVLCDHLNRSFGTYYISSGGDTRDTCYARIAIAFNKPEYCEKEDHSGMTGFSPHGCYAYVAQMTKNVSICDNIQINYAWNINEDYILNCKFVASGEVKYCDLMKAANNKIGCYANFATIKRDKNVCNSLNDALAVQSCKNFANV